MMTTWTSSCRSGAGGGSFEFAHFRDDELADALVAIHPHRRGLTLEELATETTKLGPAREARQGARGASGLIA
jgi:hypothetical protein